MYVRMYNTMQNTSDNFPSYLQKMIIVQMSVGGEGGVHMSEMRLTLGL